MTYNVITGPGEQWDSPTRNGQSGVYLEVKGNTDYSQSSRADLFMAILRRSMQEFE